MDRLRRLLAVYSATLHRRPLRTRAATTLALFTVLTALFVVATRHLVISSDQATVALQGDSMFSHSLVLAGWHTPVDNFWSTDIPLYAIGTRIAGLSPMLFRIIPALLLALLVCIGAHISSQSLPRRQGMIAALLTVIVAGLPSAFGDYAPLTGLLTEHLSTLDAAGVGWLLVRRSVDPGARWNPRGRLAVARVVAGTGFLSAAILGDPIAVFVVVAPLVILGVVDAARGNAVRRNVMLAGWAVASTAGAVVGYAAVRALGGFVLVAPLTHFAELSDIPGNTGRYVEYLLDATGASVGGHPLREPQTLLAVVHAAVALIVIGCVVRTLLRWARNQEEDLTSVALSLSWLIMSVALITSQQLGPSTQRFLLITSLVALPVGARVIAGWVQSGTVMSWAHAALCAILAIAYAGAFVPALTTSAHDSRGDVAAWLRDHGLTAGVAGYWDAQVITLDSKGDVITRPVFWSAQRNAMLPQLFLADSTWYTTARPVASTWFAVWRPGDTTSGLDETTARAAFGEPVSRQEVDGYIVETWNADVIDAVSRARDRAVGAGGDVPLKPD